MGSHLLAEITYGPYITWWKLVPFIFLLLIWARILTWIDKDLKNIPTLSREGINSGMVVAMALGIVGFLWLPGFGIAFGVFAGLMVVGLGTYVGIRSNAVGLADLKDSLIAEFAGMFGRKEKSEAETVATGDFVWTPKVGAPIRAPDEEDPNRLGYDALAIALTEPLTRGAHTVELISDKTDQASTRYFVDGVPYEGQKIDKSQLGEGIALIKRCIGLDVDEKRKPQSGKLKMAYAGTKHEVAIRTLGSSSGESIRMEFDVPARYQAKAHEMGFGADQLQYFEDTRDEGGVVLLAMPKGQGLTALEYAMLRNHDAFTSHIITIERDAPVDIEGITQEKLAGNAAPADEFKQVSWVASQDPGVILLGSVESPDSAKELLRYADAAGRRAYVGVQAGDVFEAIEKWRRLVGNDQTAFGNLKYVVAGRVFRRLCDATKIPYAPDEKLLKQLGMHASKVTELYKPNTAGVLRDARGNEVPDEYCWGIGYKGRFGVYEVMAIDDEVRAAAAANTLNPQALRTIFRKQKRKYLQELALTRVEQGDTSVQEFLRVLKPADDAKRSSSSATPSRPPSSPSAPSKPRA